MLEYSNKKNYSNDKLTCTSKYDYILIITKLDLN